MSFQLFEGAKRPTALIVLRREETAGRNYRFDYWCPKADLNLSLRRIIALSSLDRMKLSAREVVLDPHLLKRRLWTRGPDERLLDFLGTISPLSSWIRQFKEAGAGASRWNGWVIGQGFKPTTESRLGTNGYSTKEADEIDRYPYLSAKAFTTLALPEVERGLGLRAWYIVVASSTVSSLRTYLFPKASNGPTGASAQHTANRTLRSSIRCKPWPFQTKIGPLAKF
ncbi:hypothetical protein QP150_10145 [Sphingomonas sp. 22L2VL55-3]